MRQQNNTYVDEACNPETNKSTRVRNVDGSDALTKNEITSKKITKISSDKRLSLDFRLAEEAIAKARASLDSLNPFGDLDEIDEGDKETGDKVDILDETPSEKSKSPSNPFDNEGKFVYFVASVSPM